MIRKRNKKGKRQPRRRNGKCKAPSSANMTISHRGKVVKQQQHDRPAEYPVNIRKTGFSFSYTREIIEPARKILSDVQFGWGSEWVSTGSYLVFFAAALMLALQLTHC